MTEHAKTKPPTLKSIKNSSFVGQIRRNAVALISLAVALAGLGYNTWRNETTEAQRNTRYAAFRMIEELGALQQAINTATYGGQLSSDWYYVGWGKVNLIEDLSLIMPEDQRPGVAALSETWEPASKQLRGWDDGDSVVRASAREAERALYLVIQDLRTEIRAALQMLE